MFQENTTTVGNNLAAKAAAPIQGAINSLGEQLDAIDGQITNLEHILCPVLSAPTPEPANETVAGREIRGTSPYIDQLTGIEARLRGVSEALQSVVSRIEV